MELNKRTCEKCGDEKILEEDFLYHSTHKCYSRVCKSCKNEERRGKYIHIESTYIASKTCSICEETKLRITDNFALKSNQTRKIFQKICISCNEKIKEQNKQRKLFEVRGFGDDGSEKACTCCKEIKNTYNNFAYSCTEQRFKSICDKCLYEKQEEKRKNFTEEELQIHLKKGRDAYYKGIDKTLLRNYNRFDLERKYTNDLTLEFIQDSLNKECVYCSAPSTGLDRKDSNLGHTIENCVPCCRTCNTVKMDNFTYEQMLLLGETIKSFKI